MVDAGLRVELLKVWDRGEEDTHTLIGLVVEVLGGQRARVRGHAMFFPLWVCMGPPPCVHTPPPQFKKDQEGRRGVGSAYSRS